MVNHPNRSKKAKKTEAAKTESVITIKGFDSHWKCKEFQFEVGKSYIHDGDVVICQAGFHGIEGHPLQVLRYYPPNKSRYALTTQSGNLTRHSDDSKIASAHITIDAEIGLPALIERAVKWVFDRVKPEAKAYEPNGAATASGNCGAATASGYSGAATASGYSGAATASGDYGAATASGNYGKVRGVKGCALFLVYRNRNREIKHAWAGIVGQDGIKPDTWYKLDAKGVPQECS